MPLQSDEIAKVKQFLGSLLNGAAELGFSALPILSLYKRAKDERVDFWMLLLTDPDMSAKLVGAMRKHAGKLPDSFVAGLKLAIQAHGEARAQEKVRAKPPVMATQIPDDIV